MAQMRLTVLICTHNRAPLLERTLVSLNAARRPADAAVEIFVVANACSDNTLRFLASYTERAEAGNLLPLRWVEEPKPGKSHALNRAIPLLTSPIVAFVDDDHRVDPGYLVGLCDAANAYSEATLFCGRILPDWDGREPGWVHDTGPYRVYPLPVPRYDEGDRPKPIDLSGPFPGGGNLFLRREMLEKVDGFSTELGPKGHDLGGGEDSDFVLRALSTGVKLQYIPNVIQYHYVDLERFKFRYILQKSYQRSRSVARVHHGGSGAVPRYMWRKLADYLGAAAFSLSWPRTRFYLVRLAATLGEIRGMSQKPLAVPGAETDADLGSTAPGVAPVAAAMGAAAVAAMAALPASAIWQGVQSSAGIAAFFTLSLLVKSVTDFSRTGPEIREEIQRHYSGYSLLALMRLGFWSFALSGLMAGAGVAVYGCLSVYFGYPFSARWATVSAVLGIAVITYLQFCRHLLYLPATIAASSHYRLSRFYPLWRWLSPAKLRFAQMTLVLLGGVAALVCAARLLEQERWLALAGLVALGAAGAIGIRMMAPRRETVSTHPGSAGGMPDRPNIIMIGSDTLRADRLGAAGYYRSLTPHLDALAQRGAQFTNCYVPCARTAPSLVSLLTGAWPHRHRIRDNFVGDDELTLPVRGLPAILADAGYQTAVVGDWSAGDMRKFNLGFQRLDLPEDQWNIKYLIRQGPKDLRLFLSLFTHNRFGKRFLPELYYLAGVPLTREVGRDARAAINDLAAGDRPFFLNVFMATTHPPFGSEYPYYTLFSDPDYQGESKFVMARLTDPFEIIRRQGDSRKEFDLDQILNLYDGCVKCFDDEVARILAHVEACGLKQSTIVVIYSDHGMEFFEHDTWGQGNSVVGDFSLKVPLVIVDPRLAGGAVVRDIVRTIDVAPTLLDLAGVPRPDGVAGVSLAPYLRGEHPRSDLAAFAETGIWLTDLPGMPEGHLRYPNLLALLEAPNKQSGTLALKREYRDIVIAAKDRMVRIGKWKLAYQPLEQGALYKLFNVEADPKCRVDVLAQHLDVAQELKLRLAAWMLEDAACEHPLKCANGRAEGSAGVG